ncbi:hypothetical protein QVD17_41639 [Tagetes erecta]|uniref:Uncharacterized protein n=1 Tax=Tagetes erecta TaxID=13708 RepID=A0AAD8JR46_TARER|nr:hypothetical protein QVD17_41639 [Tagetes erecta]
MCLWFKCMNEQKDKLWRDLAKRIINTCMNEQMDKFCKYIPNHSTLLLPKAKRLWNPNRRITHRMLPDDTIGSRFFYYENVALALKGAWDKIYRFLFGVEPEVADLKYFCDAERKRGKTTFGSKTLLKTINTEHLLPKSNKVCLRKNFKLRKEKGRMNGCVFTKLKGE